MTDIIQIALLAFIVTLLLQKKRDMKSSSSHSRKVILDSCALIDGRIVEIVQAGFVPDLLIIPQFVLGELQLLADGQDSHKRERARFGLDVARQLQDSNACEVVIDRSDFKDILTDDKLIRLAKQTGAMLYTTDFNLNKVATIEGVKVLNVNELAQSMRPLALPGETLQVKIIQKGSNPRQGVGYTEDGTMVVVDDAAKFMHKPVRVEIVRHLQTAAGKMLFGRLVTGSKARGKVPGKTELPK